MPLMSGEFLDSLSIYAYSVYPLAYYIPMTTCGILLLIDGLFDEIRRYNIIIGIMFMGVVFFPVEEWRLTHDILAISFFLGNTFVVTYHSMVLSKIKKVILSCIITLFVTFLLVDLLNLYIVESVGMLTMSYFMFSRHLKKHQILL